MNKYLARQIVLAQIASDAGKGIHSLHIPGDEKAHRLGYEMKEYFILQAIKEIESDTVLIIVDAIDGRKTVKAAVKARAEELNAAANTGDDDDQDDQDGQNDPDGANGTGTEGDTEDGGDE